MKLDKKLMAKYAYTFSSPESHLVLKDLEDRSGFNDLTETRDPTELAYQAGARDLYLYLKTVVEESTN